MHLWQTQPNSEPFLSFLSNQMRIVIEFVSKRKPEMAALRIRPSTTHTLFQKTMRLKKIKILKKEKENGKGK